MNPLPHYAGATLSSLANLLSAGYYGMLDALLHELAPEQNAGKAENRESPLDQLRTVLAWRIETLTPYLHALAGKAASGHNCTLCTGGCDMQHQLRLMELEEGHRQFTSALTNQTDPLPVTWLMGGGAPLASVRSLRIIATAIEMIHIERMYLVPLIHKARKDIYADTSGRKTESREGERGAVLPLRHAVPAGS